MNKKRMSLLSLLALALLVLALPGIVQDAEAVIRVSASLHTPNVRVRVGNTSYSRYRHARVVRVPVRRRMYYRIAKHDWRIAQRLAWYTGVPAKKLIRLRRHGYRWFEIGRWLDLPRPVVQAAMHKRSWKRFLRTGLVDGHGPRGHKKIRIVTYYDDF
jgi:hypothetical protein